ncbi:DUF4230 domain-containing protein [Rummeliibacillus suwonensis]|uniref:DUF4230 domain-containing protein n=1 Tax=Rummeliibacillus suwonensis TaxID=1306154 RepID=UPI0011B569E8|nr:DUF4230 domain-containing protein [Rummeliibacillus suwonensis]
MKKNKELEKLLRNLHVEEEQAATIMEAAQGSQTHFQNRWRIKLLKNWKIWGILFIILTILIVPFVTWKLIQGNSFAEQKGSFVERIQDLNELTTVEVYTKAAVEQEDNKLFGKEIGMDLPGINSKILVIVPGGVKAGVDFSNVTDKNVDIDERDKTATITLPAAKILGEPELYLDKAQVFTNTGLFRSEPDIKKAYDLADEAKKQMIEEATTQGVLKTAEKNAKNSVADMFSLVGYHVTVKFKE